jgi:hypothetical protein
MKNHERTVGWVLVQALVFSAVLLLTGGLAYCEDLVTPGAPFTLTWAMPTPPADGYRVERSLNGGSWVTMPSMPLANEFTDTLLAGTAAQYRVSGYANFTVTWTDLTGAHSATSKIYGPVSEVSTAMVASSGGTPPGGCGKPTLKP